MLPHSSEASQKMRIFEEAVLSPKNQKKLTKERGRNHWVMHTQKTNVQLQHSLRRNYATVANTATQDSVLVPYWTLPGTQAQALVTNDPEISLFHLLKAVTPLLSYNKLITKVGP